MIEIFMIYYGLFVFQSPYFLSMFSGSWIESEKEMIEIDIIDENITEEGWFILS